MPVQDGYFRCLSNRSDVEGDAMLQGRTMTKKMFRGVVAISAFLLLWNLWGCASSKQAGQYGNFSHPTIERVDQKNVDQVPEDPVLTKPLPEVTGEELERSGDIYFTNGNHYMAFVQYEKALEKDPDNAKVHYKRGLLFLVTNQNEDAAKEFKRVLEKEPGHALSYEGLGEAHFQMKKYSEAEKDFRKALELDPKLWKARNFLGNIYDFQKKYDKACHEYAEAIFLRPDEALLYNNLGVSLSLAGRYGEAINAFKNGLGAKGPK
jgi:tetratricopeptide (TPR) repeat protein